MSDKIYLGSRLDDLDFGEPSLPISKVILNVDSETCYQSGDDTGATIEADCPWATQAMADSILAKMQGFIYKPFDGTDALLNPAAELGDGITLGGVYSVLSQLGRNLDRQASATVGAPGTDEIEDEYPYKSKQRKQTDRTLAKAYSLISKTASEIRLEVADSLNNLSSSINIELDKITAEVFTEDGGSRIDQTAEGIRAEIFDEETGAFTTLSAEIGSIKSEIYTDEGESRIDQTATAIRQEVSDTLGNYSTIQQTSNSISSAVSGLINGDQAQTLIDQSLEKIELSVSNGSTSSTISLKAGETVIDSASISFSGFVTYSGLSGGTTIIDGACIKTGTIAAERLNLSGAISFNDFDDDTQEYISGLGSDITLPDYIKSTYIDETEIRSPTIIGGTIYAANENAYTVMTSYGLQMFVNDVSKPKIELVNYSNLIQLNLGAGVSTGDNIYGTFGLQKTTTNAGCYYWSGTNYGTMCGFTFNNDGTITVHGTLVDTNGNALIGG